MCAPACVYYDLGRGFPRQAISIKWKIELEYDPISDWRATNSSKKLYLYNFNRAYVIGSDIWNKS